MLPFRYKFYARAITPLTLPSKQNISGMLVE